jgi:transposase
MAGITDAQVKELRRQLQLGASLQKAALKSGMDRKSAAKYREGKMPNERRKTTRSWRTRLDPLAAVWPELQVELERAPELQALTLLTLLQERYPGQYSDDVLRTLQRRVKQWRALHGPAKELFFRQVHEPGRLGSSDFTHMNAMGVTIQGQRFDHLLYHFVLTSSNWEHITVCFSESFASLSEGLQNALWALGGVPRRHRTDRMTLAVHPDGNPEVFTRNYQALMKHYGIEAEATNPYSGHENGDCEQAHHRFKQAVDQALLVRGSRDFASREEYETFLRQVQDKRNAGRRQKVADEVTHLCHLPPRRLETLLRLRVKVSQGSTIRVLSNTYSVPARLKGEVVDARVGTETVEVWYADQLQLTVPRLRGEDNHRVDYRHVIDWLVRKPGAFARYCYQADLFPTSRFRQAYDELARTQSERVASRIYLEILQLAARGSESLVDGALAQLLAQDQAISVTAVRALISSDTDLSLTALVRVPPVDLRIYDELLPSLAESNTSQETTTGSGEAPPSVVDQPSAETCVDLSTQGTQGTEEAKDEPGTGTEPQNAGDVSCGTSSGDDAPGMRGGGPTGPAGIVELPGFSAGTERARGAAAPPESHRPAAEVIAVAAGKELAEPGPETSARESGAATAELAGRGLSGSPREHFGIRQCGFGEDAQPVRGGPGTGAAGAAHPVHDDEPAGAGTAEGQTGPGPESTFETTELLGRVADRRPGLCAAEPGRDGGAVHAAGGALRERQRVGDEQPGVLAMGTDLQGPDDDGGGDRPSGAPQCDRGVERAELPSGGGQEGQGPTVAKAQGSMSDDLRISEEQCLSPGEGRTSRTAVGGWLRSAHLREGHGCCATTPFAPVRYATPAPHGGGFTIQPLGISNCR